MPPKNVHKYFSKTFNRLLEYTTGKQIAHAMQVSEGSITAWKKEDANPNIESLSLIANHFRVTPNFLLGYKEKDGTNEYLYKFRAHTGLSDQAIQSLHKKLANKRQMYALNYLLTDDTLLESLTDYLLQKFYSDFHADPQFKLLPKRHLYTTENEFLFTLIAALTHSKEKFSAYVKDTPAIHTEIKMDMWDQEVDREMCEALTIYPLIEMESATSIETSTQELIASLSQIPEDTDSSNRNTEETSPDVLVSFPEDSSIQEIRTDGTLRFRNPKNEHAKVAAMRQYLRENDAYRAQHQKKKI